MGLFREDNSDLLAKNVATQKVPDPVKINVWFRDGRPPIVFELEDWGDWELYDDNWIRINAKEGKTSWYPIDVIFSVEEL